MMNYYLGKIVEVVDRVTYEVKVSIDGIVDSKPAFPFRGEVDEPKVGDMVMCKNIDPIYQSMYLYQKLKEDEFIGFRSNGKSIEITPDYIEMKVYKFDEAKDSQSAHDDFTGFISRIKIDKEGNIDIDTKPGNVTINIDGDVNSTIKGNLTSLIEGESSTTVKGDVFIQADNNVNVTIDGETTLVCPSTVIKGPGTLQVKAQSVVPKLEGGPFCTFKVAPPAGTPMVSGDTIILKS